MTHFNFDSTGEEVVLAFQDRIKDRIILITGPSNGGIGGETAMSLAAGKPSNLILIRQDISKVQPVIDTIRLKSPQTTIFPIQCDLSCQQSVRRAATQIMTLVPHIDILINNAAIPPCPYSKTEDGIETQFATNHIGHFLLTNLLKPTILAAESGARIVSVSSSAHRHRQHARFDDYNFSDGKTYSAWEGYMQSKLANVLFSVSLAEKLARHQVQSFSLHPGSIDSGMQAHVPEDAMANALRQRREEAEREGREIKRAKRKTIQQGCATALVAALDPSIAGLSGSYLEDGNVMENNYAIDNENAERLWILSEELVGQKFEWE